MPPSLRVMEVFVTNSLRCVCSYSCPFPPSRALTPPSPAHLLVFPRSFPPFARLPRELKAETSSLFGRDKEFRDACDATLKQIALNSERPGHAPADLGGADLYFFPFKLAAESKTTKLRHRALHAIEKMISALGGGGAR